MALSRADILGDDPPDRAEVDVPEWGDTVTVRRLTAGERAKWERYVAANKNVNFGASLVLFAVCDENGDRLFEDGDLPALAKKSAAALDRVAAVALKINRVLDGDVTEYEKRLLTEPARRMIIRLAVVLGRTIREIEAMDSDELSWWFAASRVGLLPDPWHQTGVISASVMNAMTKRKDGRSWQADDFIPTTRKRVRKMSEKEIVTAMKNAADAFDKVSKKRNPGEDGIRRLRPKG